MAGVGAAYYLVHSMARGEGYRERDLAAARAFGRAAAAAGVARIVYLGGLGDPSADLSRHLRSRQETGEALREAGVPVTEFRAAVIVGSGSLSFEMIRYLTERVPVMICPHWVYTRVQPIAIDDVLAYLVAALEVPESAGRVIEIGGSDVLTYGEMMIGYAPRAASGGTCSRCPCSRRRCRRTGCTSSRPSRRRSRGRSSRGCATRPWCATIQRATSSRRSTPWATRRRCAPRSPVWTRGRSRPAGPTRSSPAAVTSSRACSPRRRASSSSAARRWCGDARGDLRRHLHHRRAARLSRLGLGLGAARRRRPAGRRRGPAPRPPRSRRPARRRRARLLARRGGRARPAAAPACRDEGARARRGCSSRRCRTTAARCSSRPRSSRHAGSPAWPTGTRCCLSTAGYSRV